MNWEACHIKGKNNALVDMLLRARYKGESDVVSEDDDVALEFFKITQASAEERGVWVLNTFNKSEYDGGWRHIGRFFSSLTTDASWTKEETQRIRKKSYKYFLQGGYL